LHMNSAAAKASNDPASSANAPSLSPNFATSGTSSFAGISSSLAGMSTSTGASIGIGSDGNLDFTTSATSGVVVFDLEASDLSSTVVGGVTEYGNSYYNGTSWNSFAGIQITVPSGVDYVINVLGLAANSQIFSNVNINSGTNNDQLLWNFNESSNTTISVGGNFYGSILAPNVNLTDTTTINGTVVANSFTDDNVELHDSDEFVSEVVPESGSYALGGLALCLAAALGGGSLRRLLPFSRARS
ncbi:MAG TPA: collagen-binding domain-containing protein, partial [Opitutaceae bacterium]|nr:collagen-binding domain-containing protein [Opitutaceae bacterium]